MTHLTLVVSNHWTGLWTELMDWIVEEKFEINMSHKRQLAELVNGTRYHVV